MSEPHSHLIPVPVGMTAEESWQEITTIGRLIDPPADDDACEWATVECSGECSDVDRSPNYRRWHNDVLIEAWVAGERVL